MTTETMTELDTAEQQYQWASDHAKHSNVLRVMEWPGDEEAIRLMGLHHIRSDIRVPAAAIEDIAPRIEKQYPGLVEDFRSNPRNIAITAKIREKIRLGHNVSLVTPHSETIDVALAQAIVLSEIEHVDEKQSPLDESEKTELTTAIIISRMIQFLEHKMDDDWAKVSDTIQWLDNLTLLSIPDTQSSEKRGLRDNGQSNSPMMNAHEVERRNGRMFSSIAASGTIDKITHFHSGIGQWSLDRDSIVTSEKVNDGTCEILINPETPEEDEPLTYVVGVMIWYKDGRPVMELVDDPTLLYTHEDAHNVMESITTGLTERVEGYEFIYLGRSAIQD